MIKVSCNRVNLDKLKRQAQTAQKRLPALFGAEAVRHTKDNFRQGGFVDSTLQPWKPRKKDTDAGRGILIGKGTGHLMKDVRVLQKFSNGVKVGTTLPYAKIHNDGGTINHPGGTSFFPKKGKIIWVSNRVASTLATAGRKLPKTKAHRITIPARKFLGKSVQLGVKLREIVKREMSKLTNK